MAIVGDILKVVFNMTNLGQLCQCVLHYQYTGVDPITESDVAAEIGPQIVTAMKALQHSEVEHGLVQVYNLTDEVGYGQESMGGTPGDITAVNPLPAYMAYKFVAQRAGVAERNGYLRLTGLDEATVTGDVLLSSLASAATALSTALGSELFPAGNPLSTFTPGTYSKWYNGQLRVPPVLWNRVGRWVFGGLTTQNTRKR